MQIRQPLRLIAFAASVALAPAAAAAQSLYAPPASLPVGGGPSGVATGDFNGDGRADAVVAN